MHVSVCLFVGGRESVEESNLFGDQPFSHAVSTPTFIVEQVLPFFNSLFLLS